MLRCGGFLEFRGLWVSFWLMTSRRDALGAFPACAWDGGMGSGTSGSGGFFLSFCFVLLRFVLFRSLASLVPSPLITSQSPHGSARAGARRAPFSSLFSSRSRPCCPHLFRRGEGRRVRCVPVVIECLSFRVAGCFVPLWFLFGALCLALRFVSVFVGVGGGMGLALRGRRGGR